MIKTVKKSLNYCHRTKYCQNAPLCNRMMMMSSPAPRCDVIRLGSIPENNSQMRIENNVGHIVLAAPPPVLTPPNSQGCVFTRFLCVLNGILLPKLFWPTVRKKMFYWSRKTFEIREFANFLRSVEQFIQTMKGQNNFW